MPEGTEIIEEQPLAEEPTPGADPEQDPAPAAVETPAIDLEAERAKWEAEYIAKQQESQARALVEKPEKPAKPDMYEDPEGYEKWVLDQAMAKVDEKYAPIIARVNQDMVTNRLTQGMGEHGRALVSKIAPNLNVTQLSPELEDLIVSAGKWKDHEKAPKTVNPERPYSERGVSGLTAEERDMYLRSGLTEADILAIKRETKGL